MTFSGRFLLNIIHFAVRQGASLSELLALAAHTEEELWTEDFRVDAAIYNRVLESAIANTNDPLFGLHIGESLNLSAAGLISQITQTSPTVRKALEYCCEFANLGCRALPLQLEDQGEVFRLSFIPDRLWLEQSKDVVKHTIDGTLAFTVREYHTLSRQAHHPKEIHLSLADPAQRAAYEKAFRCPVVFNQAETSLFLPASQVNQPVVTSDYNLLRVLVAHAQEKLQSLEKEAGFSAQVKRTVLHLVMPGFPSIEQVAANLNLSVRSLQRKLKDENRTFKEIVESIRQEMAINYLQKPELSVGEVAYLLNYSDASAFVRSFKRWTGHTPQVYRDQVMA